MGVPSWAAITTIELRILRAQRDLYLPTLRSDRLGPPLQSLSGFVDSFLALVHPDPPFIFVRDKDQPGLAHQIADQIINRRDHFDGWPHKFPQPHFMQDAFELHQESFYGRTFLEDLAKTRRVVLKVQFQSVGVAEQVAGTDEHVPENLLNLRKAS